MKRIVFIVIILLAVKLQAQQRPHYTQYILNNYIINPAVAGIENYTDVKLSYRHQWVGIQDAPVTSYLTIHGAINKKDYRTTATSFDVPGENPRGKSYWEDYTSAAPHMGWGAQIINDKTGPLQRFSAYGTFSYHTGLTPKTSLAAGISFGVTNNSLNASKLIFDVPVDPAVASSNVLNKLKPDISAGLWLYSADYFVGLSALQIMPQGLDFSDGTLKVKRKSFPHTFLTAGYRFFLNDDINLIPSAVLRYVDPLPLGVDLNIKAQYRDRLWVGAGYRLGDGFSGMLGVNVSNTFNIGYAYDYSTSPLRSYTSGTHELVIGFLLGNNFGDLCPRNVW